MHTAISKNLAHQVRRTVHDLGMVKKVWHGCNKAAKANAANDTLKIALAGFLDLRQDIDRTNTCRLCSNLD